ncbi:hypothetical protein NBRC116584_14460 [Hydrogenophaga sp. 5NK40-0174]
MAAYLCTHLHDQPAQRWHGHWPSDREPRPGAWCDQCHAAYLEEGEWNASNGQRLQLRRVCHHCYDELRSASVGRLQGAKAKEWAAMLASCEADMRQRQSALHAAHALEAYPDRQWDAQAGSLVLSGGTRAPVRVRMAYIGSYAKRQKAWRWSWAATGLNDEAREAMVPVRDLGERMDWPHLTVAQWQAEPLVGWQMSAVALRVQGGTGVYRLEGDNADAYWLVESVALAKPGKA